MFIGRKIEVGLAKETSRGTPATPAYWVFKTSASVQDKPIYANDETSVGNISDTLGSRITGTRSEGEIAGKVTDQSIGLLLLAAIGSVSSAVKGGESVVYEHTYSLLNTNAHPTLTIEVKDGNEQQAFANACLETLKISAEVEKYLSFAATFKAKGGASAANTPSYIATENDFIATEAAVKLATNLAGLDAASPIAVRSIELSIEKNAKYLPKLGQLAPADIVNEHLVITGNIEADYADTATFKDLFTAGTFKALRLIITSGTLIGTASYPTIQIDLAKVAFQDWSRPSENDKVVTQTVKFKAHLSLADSAIISAKLTNKAVSY